MTRLILICSSLFLVAISSGCSDAKDEPVSPADSGSSALQACPDEQNLADAGLPCDCYGHEANATSIVDPSCKTQVVCCPTTSNLRCEDHEYLDDAGNFKDAAVVSACKNEVNLATQTLPCNCYGTVVEDAKTAMPSCSKTVVCCPGTKGLKCE